MEYLQGIIAATLLFCSCSYAANEIDVHVYTEVSNAVAIGFKVNGIEQGGLGKSYKGRGANNSEYYFGYREDSVFGRDVNCGSLLLNDKSKVKLIKYGDLCFASLE